MPTDLKAINILGIETSCDETAAAVVRDGKAILSNVIASQVDIHSRYGGIVPEVASRQHLLSITPIIGEAMKQAHMSWKDLDAVAVTNGPGLAGSLLVGVNAAKSITAAHDLKLIGINHLEGHVYANWLDGNVPEFPALCLIVSGGHSDILLMEGHGHYKILGRTRDDAAGEAFDKVSRLLGLGYPGGPAVEKAARGAEDTNYRLPRAWLKETDDFSFSGLKTAVLHLVQADIDSKSLSESDDLKLRTEIAAAFQASVIDVLASKTIAAAERCGARNILLCGGVAANRALRHEMQLRCHLPLFIPEPVLCTDNAAMIAACGYYHMCNGKFSDLYLDVKPNAAIPQI